MWIYAPSELRLLLVLAGVLLAGVGVREWRAGFPAHADRLEQFDRQTRPPAPPPGAIPVASVRPPAGGAPPAGGDMDPRPLDLNRASAEQLARLPGVSESLARRIVVDREQAGPFASPCALRRVRGVGPRTLAGIRRLVTAGGQPSPIHAPLDPPRATGQESREAARAGTSHAEEPGRRGGPLPRHQDR